MKAKDFNTMLMPALLALNFCLISSFTKTYAQPLSLPTYLQDKIPLDPETLTKAPEFRRENKKDSVWSLFYLGEEFEGQQTEVFAWYASPATLSGKKSKRKFYPAVVLVHGGGGMAFAIWVHEWAKRGFAATAMDLGKSSSKRTAFIG